MACLVDLLRGVEGVDHNSQIIHLLGQLEDNLGPNLGLLWLMGVNLALWVSMAISGTQWG